MHSDCAKNMGPWYKTRRRKDLSFYLASKSKNSMLQVDVLGAQVDKDTELVEMFNKEEYKDPFLQGLHAREDDLPKFLMVEQNTKKIVGKPIQRQV